MVGAPATESDWKRYAEASITLFDILLEESRAEVIIASLARIVGETLGVDRCLIFDISYPRDEAICLTKWIDPARPEHAPSRDNYPLGLFRSGLELVRRTHDRLESQASAPHEVLAGDAAALLHGRMGIQSLLWYPFLFGDEGFYLLAFNHVHAPHVWTEAELEFMRAVTRHVSVALVKIRLIEERSRAERAAFAAQKLESLGLLAGGVAHDFNNLMVVVIANADLIDRRLPADSNLRELVRWIRDSGQRAAALAGQMLAYAGKGTPEVARVDPRIVVDQAVQLVRASFPDVTVEVSGDPPTIACNRAQFEQVMMNLVVNAAEAASGRPGRIAIRFAQVELAAAPGGRRWVPADPPPGAYVQLEVTDDGIGMDAATLARIFDPFFSTKFEGRGLGLSAVQGIVRDHGGALHVTSAPGRGTTFTVLWPPSSGAPLADAVVHPEYPRHGKVLVIDDESSVAAAVAAVLEDRGFSCDVAIGGAAGMDAFRTRGASIDCVLLDLTMPAPGSHEVLRALRHDRPQLPVVLMSGYTENALEWSRLAGPATRFVRKPFSSDDLVTAVATAIARGAA
ncbi:MAG: response regulator [Deltaproteobacteria bacterium]|nr:response regulator [Deltaproteobacteria bacterium]MCW5801699.1 response regulator [Deltaproteobacteria bacterium]